MVACLKLFTSVSLFGVMPERGAQDKREDHRRATEAGENKGDANKLWIKCSYVHYMNNPKGMQSLCVHVMLSSLHAQGRTKTVKNYIYNS